MDFLVDGIPTTAAPDDTRVYLTQAALSVPLSLCLSVDLERELE
jgi:hypothetical protein